MGKRIFPLTVIATLILSLFFTAPARAAGTACPTTYCNLATSYFKIGNGSENSINTAGFLQQPFYWSSTASAWRQYTFSTGAYQVAYGVGTGGSAWNGNQFLTNPVGTVTYDYSNFVVTSTAGSVSTGYGTITSTNVVTVGGIQFSIRQDFILGQTSYFLKVVTTVTNNSASTATNFNEWVGPSDDYAGGCDTNTKDRGNFSGGTFTILSSATAANQNAVRITCGGVNETEYLTSPTVGAKTIIPVSRFSGVPTGNPTTTTLITETSDNGYGLQVPFGDIAAGGSSSAVWYLAGAANADMTSSVTNAISSPIAPSVTTMASSVASNNNITSSGNFSYNLVFSSAVTGLAANDFTLSGTGSSTCSTPSVSGSGTTYTVSLTGCSEGLVVISINANAVTDGSNNTGPTSPFNATAVRIDQTAPLISSVTAPANANYTPTQQLNFTAIFNESVTVTGSPRIQLTLGVSTRYATFVSMTDSRTATFRYTIAADQSETDLDGIDVLSPLAPNSGSIQDLATNAMTVFTFTSPTTTGVKIYQAPNAPNIDSITVNNTSVVVFFTAGSTNGSVVSNYKYSTNNGVSFTALATPDSITPITIPGLTSGTTYQFVIKAVSNLGDGLASNMLAATPTTVVGLTISLSASATTVAKGTPITVTVAVSQPGLVTFLWNNERIAGCIKKPVTSSGSCVWKPTVSGQWTLKAVIEPTDKSYLTSYSQNLPVFILRRSGTR